MADLPVRRQAGFGLVRGQRCVSGNDQSGMEGGCRLEMVAEKTLECIISHDKSNATWQVSETLLARSLSLLSQK